MAQLDGRTDAPAPPVVLPARPPLADLLDRLEGLAGEERRPRIADLRARLAVGRLRVLLVGEAKRGKSTLGNALLGRDVLPTGVTPVTAITTQVVPAEGGPECIEVTGTDGTVSRSPLSALADLVSEQGNPQNVRGVADIVVRLRSRLADRGVTLVDTPGVGSALAHNTAEAQSAYDRMDAAVVVLTADPPASASELELLGRIRAASVRTFVVLNKVDRLDPVERAEAMAYVSSLVGDERVYPCSARYATAEASGAPGSGSAGFDEFAADLTAYLAERAVVDLERSLRMAAVRIARDALDDALVEGAVLRADTEGQRAAVSQFLSRTRDLAVLADAADGRLAHLHHRLREDLDGSARAEVARLRPEVREAVDGALEARRGSAFEELDAAAREALAAVVGPAAHAWQVEREAEIRDRVEQSVTMESARLRQACAGIRDAAAQLLQIDLSVRDVGVDLPRVPLVPLDFAAEVGWRPPLAGAARRLLTPGRAYRRAVVAMAEEGSRLTDRHVGRARSNLQAGLDELARTYHRSLAVAYADAGTRFGSVVEDARDRAEEATSSLTSRSLDNGARLADLERLVAELEPPEAVPAGLRGTARPR